MTNRTPHPGRPKRTAVALLAAAALAGLSACASKGGSEIGEGIGFREARFQEISAARDWRDCRDQALEMDKQARVSESAGGYLTSAQIIEKCETALDGGNNGVAREERMRVYALAVQNYFKGGDVAGARRTLSHFRTAFPDHDIYYVDGSSFIATMQALLGQAEPWTFGEFAALNVNTAFKGEMRRMHYWKRK